VTRTVVFVAGLLFAVPWLARRRRAWIALGIAATGLMALSRIEVSAHYMSDTLGGVLLGASVVAAWSLVPDRVFAKR
jgi:membrane-associated phospholipid phosphatase